jgi:hypothetical protein
MSIGGMLNFETGGRGGHARVGRPLTATTDENVESVRRLLTEKRHTTLQMIDRFSKMDFSNPIGPFCTHASKDSKTCSYNSSTKKLTSLHKCW